MAIEEIPVLFDDLENTSQMLGACLTYFVAQDISRAQIAFSANKKSQIVQELESVKDRIDGYIGDWLLQRHLESKKLDDVEEIEDSEIEDNEELSPEPLPFTPPKQQGRRIDIDAS